MPDSAAVSDTHALIFHAIGNKRLGKRADARPNNDPFDALICAAARSLDLPLISRDSDIQESGLVKVIW